jgi:hypothetical protein
MKLFLICTGIFMLIVLGTSNQNLKACRQISTCGVK